jgi:phage shock protein PspC (stress-responsive transcriptional regulator)
MSGHLRTLPLEKAREGEQRSSVGNGLTRSETMDREHKLDKHEAVLMGVCVRLADWADVDPLLVRVNALLIGLLLAPVVLPAYGVAGLLLGRRTLAC